MHLSSLKPGAAFRFWSADEPVYIIGENGVPVNTETGEAEALHPESIVVELRAARSFRVRGVRQTGRPDDHAARATEAA